MSEYTSDGLRLHYDVTGNQGPVILCVHGATGTGSFEWDRLTEQLSDTFRVVKPDLRGHGRSEHRSGQLSLELIEADLCRLIDAEGLDRPHIMGFSFGSEVALRLVLDHPGMARSLVLVSPGLGTVKQGAAAKAEVPSRELLEKSWPRHLRGLHTEGHGPDHWIDIMQDMWVRHAERALVPLESLKSLNVPVLLICGSRDDPRRIKQAHLFAEAAPVATYVEIPDGRHAVHHDHATEVESIITRFLKDPLSLQSLVGG